MGVAAGRPAAHRRVDTADGKPRCPHRPRRAEAAQTIVDDALLTVDDLGDGWELTRTTPAGEEDDDASPIDECAPSADVEANDLAESEDREFTKEGDLLPSQVQVSAGATEDPDLITRVHVLIGDEELQDCLGEAFVDTVGGQAGVEVELGDIESHEDLVDVDGIRSTELRMPITISAEGVSVELGFRFVVVSTEHIGAAMVVSAPDDAVSDEQVVEWATLLAERLTAGG